MDIAWSAIATHLIEGLIGFVALGLFHFFRRLYRDINAAFYKIRTLEKRLDELGG